MNYFTLNKEYLSTGKLLYNNLFLNVLVLLIPVVISLIVTLLYLHQINNELDSYTRIYGILIFDSTFVISFYILHRIKRNKAFSELWGKTTQRGTLPTVFLVVIFVYTCIELYFYLVLGQKTIEFNPNVDILLLISTFVMLIVVAIMEELVFRAYLLRLIYSYTKSTISAIILSSIFFAIIHIGKTNFDIYNLISLFIVGILLSVIVIKTGFLWITIVIHLLHNIRHHIIFHKEYSVFQKLYAYDSISFQLFYENMQYVVICLIILVVFRTNFRIKHWKTKNN